MYRSEIFYGKQHFAPCEAIRTAVFIEEQGFHGEFDEIDDRAWHTIVYDGEKPIATGRAFLNEDGVHTIGRVAALQEYRGKGAGTAVLRALEEKLRQEGATTVCLSAQIQAMGFYRALGYQPEGAEYLDEHCPHITMKKQL